MDPMFFCYSPRVGLFSFFFLSPITIQSRGKGEVCSLLRNCWATLLHPRSLKNMRCKSAGEVEFPRGNG